MRNEPLHVAHAVFQFLNGIQQHEARYWLNWKEWLFEKEKLTPEIQADEHKLKQFF